ncbi:hypothetical protein AMATHDRAFT_4802 [Amanita thiersii Skay4041]|uniref:Uncharacterized protein n=1 Tax=Amanita thiersii Skay4041 TaxID=703135 RepID=A0A2A9NP72_9AGAR|nr:hypothetical protein AMATHDRAFT_4802 [Amanita thiersii Skay4041]
MGVDNGFQSTTWPFSPSINTTGLNYNDCESISNNARFERGMDGGQMSNIANC